MSELKPCPFCGSTAVVKCRVDSDWGVDLKYRLLNDESNYDIKSMIADENYDSDEQSGDYWGIEIFRCQSCRAEWGGGTDVCVAALTARIAELEGFIDQLLEGARGMSEMSDMHKLIMAMKLAKTAQVGMELTYFDVIELLGELDSLKSYIAELEGKIDQLTALDAIERQDDKSSNDTQTQTIVYGKEREE